MVYFRLTSGCEPPSFSYGTGKSLGFLFIYCCWSLGISAFIRMASIVRGSVGGACINNYSFFFFVAFGVHWGRELLSSVPVYHKAFPFQPPYMLLLCTHPTGVLLFFMILLSFVNKKKVSNSKTSVTSVAVMLPFPLYCTGNEMTLWVSKQFESGLHTVVSVLFLDAFDHKKIKYRTPPPPPFCNPSHCSAI